MTYTTEELQAMLDASTPGVMGGLSTFAGEAWHSAAGSHDDGSWNTIAVFKEKGDLEAFLAAPDLAREVIELREQVSRLKLDLIAALGEGIEAAPARGEPIADIFHEEQTRIWAQEILEALAMLDALAIETYGKKVSAFCAVQNEIRSIGLSVAERADLPAAPGE